MKREGVDRNDLAHWFPRLKALCPDVPETVIVQAEGEIAKVAYGEPCPEFEVLVEKLAAAAESLGGFPVFLRTGHGSGKHDWEDTCMVPSREALARHAGMIIQWSECVDFFGLPVYTWVVRRLLPLVATFKAFHGKMPINKERRYFIRDGRIQCAHPYWPEFAIRSPDCDDWREKLRALNHQDDNERSILREMTERIAGGFDNFAPGVGWSLDWAQAESGRWYAIDMAVAEDSFHWPGCPYAPPDAADRYELTPEQRDELAAGLLESRP